MLYVVQVNKSNEFLLYYYDIILLLISELHSCMYKKLRQFNNT